MNKLKETRLAERIKEDVRSRLLSKRALDASTDYAARESKDTHVTTYASVSNASDSNSLTFTVFQEGYIMTGYLEPDFFYKGTLKDLYNRLDEQPIEIRADHHSLFTVATVSKKDFSLVDVEDGRQRLDVSITLDNSPISQQLKAQYAAGQVPAISAEFFAKFVYNEELEAFAANTIDLESIALVRNPAVVEAFGDITKDSYNMSKSKNYEAEEAVVEVTDEVVEATDDVVQDSQEDVTEVKEEVVEQTEEVAETEDQTDQVEETEEAEDAAESEEVTEEQPEDDVADQVLESYNALKAELEEAKAKIAEYEAKEAEAKSSYTALETKYSALQSKLSTALESVEVRKNYTAEAPRSKGLFEGVELK